MYMALGVVILPSKDRNLNHTKIHLQGFHQLIVVQLHQPTNPDQFSTDKGLQETTCHCNCKSILSRTTLSPGNGNCRD